MKTLCDLVPDVEDAAVIEAVARLYEQEKTVWLPDAIRDVLGELRGLTPSPEGAEYELHIERTESFVPGEESYPDVFCRKAGDTERHGLDLSPWEGWLAIRVPEPLLEAMPVAEIVAHCVWEMTFYGFDRKLIAENRAELELRVREIDEGKVEMIPWEDVKARLREKFPGLESRDEAAPNDEQDKTSPR